MLDIRLALLACPLEEVMEWQLDGIDQFEFYTLSRGFSSTSNVGDLVGVLIVSMFGFHMI